MEGDYISRAEHKEFAIRMDEANERLNKRVGILEDTVRQIGALTTSVEKLAVSVENMAKEQTRQSEQLQKLESHDGEMWRKIVGYVITAVAGIVIGFVFKQLGM